MRVAARAADAGGAASVVAVGNFDGVHVGHRAILRALVESAARSNAESVVLTFRPHPAAVLTERGAPPRLASDGQQEELLADCGVSVLVRQPFDLAFAAMRPAEFIDRVLRAELGAIGVVVGEGFRFAAARAGTVEHLRASGLEVTVVAPWLVAGEAVSSSRVRRLVAEGDDEQAWTLLERPYAFEGLVVPGARLGRTIGVPTANLVPGEMALPARGVHVSATRWQERWWPSVTNVGTRPTVSGQGTVVETHLLGDPGPMEGSAIRVAMLGRLRDERRFDGLAELKEAIASDIASAGRAHAGLGVAAWRDGLGGPPAGPR